jgi:hypothetical protein
LRNVDQLTEHTVPIVGIGIEQRANVVHLTESSEPNKRIPRIYAASAAPRQLASLASKTLIDCVPMVSFVWRACSVTSFA